MTVKALTHWIIYKGYKVRFQQRGQAEVRGVLTTPAGETAFVYLPAAMQVRLPDQWITINEHGWELRRTLPNPTPDGPPPGRAPKGNNP